MRDTCVRERLKSYGLIERDCHELADAGARTDAIEAVLAWESTILSVVVIVPRRALTAKDLGVPSSLDDGSVLARPAVRGEAPRIFLPDGTDVPHNSRAWIRIDGTRVTLRLDRVAREPRSPRATFADQDARASFGIALLAHALLFAALFGLARVTPPSSAEDDIARVEVIRAYLSSAGDRATSEEAAEVADLAAPGPEASGTGGGPTGSRARGEEGSMGNPAHADTHASYELHAAKPRTTTLAEFDPTHGGMLALIADEDRDTNERNAFADHDVPGAMGNIWTTSIDDAFGAGSLGLSGVGEGGGASGAGIGLQSIGTVGHAGGSRTSGSGLGGTCDAACMAARGAIGEGEGSGFGTCGFGCRGRLGASHITRAPSIRCGGVDENGHDTGCRTQIYGRLPPEMVQRVVRANFGRLRACYETGLAKNPSLEGRVSVAFVIDRSGAVTVATLADGSTMPDAMVSACVVRAYLSMSFPQPEGGTVNVIYPVTFSPA